MRPVTPGSLSLLTVLIVGFSLLSCSRQAPAPAPPTEAEQFARGQYLVTVEGCDDCHTPGYFYGSPDRTRRLSGSELGWKGPWGVTYARNITPDPQTGIGTWSYSDIIIAIRTGKRPDGTVLLPPMPWTDLASLKDEDATAIAKYLKTLTPVMHQVPDKLPPNARPTGAFIEFPPPPPWDVPKSPPSTAP